LEIPRGRGQYEAELRWRRIKPRNLQGIWQEFLSVVSLLYVFSASDPSLAAKKAIIVHNPLHGEAVNATGSFSLKYLIQAPI